MKNLIFGVLAASCLGCATLPAVSDEDSGGLSSTEQPLLGRADDRTTEVCTPYTLNQYERALNIASAVVQSPLFAACVVDRVQLNTIPCAPDPNSSWGLTAQANSLVGVMREGTHMQLACDYYDDGLGDAASGGSFGGDSTRGLWLGGVWTREAWDRSPAPWSDRAAALVHEYAHGHGYDHFESCANTPDDPACAWTTFADAGSGLMPMGRVPGGPDHQEVCSVLAGLPDRAYQDRSQMIQSAPPPRFLGVEPIFQAETCARDMASIIERVGIIFRPACSCVDSTLIPLRTSYDATSHTFAGCACVSPQRHNVYFRTYTNHYVNAGPSAGSLEAGMSETFYLIDHNGGELTHDDEVSIKINSTSMLYEGDMFLAAQTVDGPLTLVNDNGITGTRFRIRLVAGSGTINAATLSGVSVALWSPSTNRYVMPAGGGGGVIGAYATAIGAFETLRMFEPRRLRVAYVQTTITGSPRVVSIDPSSTALTHLPLAPEYTTGTCDAGALTDAGGGFPCPNTQGTLQQRQQAFWIIDHNGGDLANGDTVSFESTAGEGSQFFWSTCASGTGNVRGDAVHLTAGCRRFIFNRVPGTSDAGASDAGPATNGTSFTLRDSASLRYLTASSAAPFRITAAATSVGPAQRFTFVLPQGNRF